METPQSDPRLRYKDPESLQCDASLSLDDRERLLMQWKDTLDERLNSEAEGMGGPSPMTADKEGQLADEERRVNIALNKVLEELKARKSGSA